MSEMVEPALTPEEWAAGEKRAPLENGGRPGDEALVAFHRGTVLVCEETEGATIVVPPLRHALAALCLHGQPFGFTWEMVNAISALAMPYAGDPLQGLSPEERSREISRIMALARDAAERIAALLPPENIGKGEG